MYLSKEQIGSILRKNGYPPFDEILVSSETNKSKKKGDIYDFFKDKYNPKRIIHVGDNYISDVENAKKAEIDAYYYKNANDIGSRNRISGMSYITGRIYSALVNNHLYSENKAYDEPYPLLKPPGWITLLSAVRSGGRFFARFWRR